MQQFTIHNEICSVQLSGETIYSEKLTKGALLPIKEQFKKYLEHGGNFKFFINKLNTLNNDTSNISHFVKGQLWKNKISQYVDKIVFPFFLYMDDLEINNLFCYYTILNIYYILNILSKIN